MTSQATHILAEALLLSEQERAHIVQELLATLAPEQLDDDAVEAELVRRRAEYKRDSSTATAWSKLRTSP